MRKLVLSLALLPAVLPAQEVSVRSLLLEMSDLTRLARAPDPAYVTRQASSYDRASKSPADAAAWFGNKDYGNYLRVERRQGRDEYVMADLKGPGAVMRIWSANPQGTLRIYVDGSPDAELVAKMDALLSGELADFPPPFSHRLAGGANLYYPIPYRKSLKITVDALSGKPEHIYYQIGFRTYENGVRVRSFSLLDVKDAAKISEKVGAAIANPKLEPSRLDRLVSMSETIAPGRVAVLRTPEGSGMIRQLTFTTSAQGEDLRKVFFEADFDGEQTVSAPIGDFFGSAPGANDYDSLPMTISPVGMVSRWVMPQRDVARLFFTNYSDKPVSISVDAVFAPEPWKPGTMYFHAKWRRETMSTRPMRDWNFIDAGGSGRFVGAAMFISNPVADWWGEGDEKIYVDGEDFPSTFGTGTEDYFGYAWSSPELFYHAYHNQIRCDGPGTRGYSAINRFHIADDLPWKSSFKFDMEIWHWKEVNADFAATVYWYAAPGSKDNFRRPSQPDLSFFTIPSPYKAQGAIEGESLKLLGKTNGETQIQRLGETWSNFEQIWWRDAIPGARIRFEVPAPAEGRYRLSGVFCAAVDYGIVQLYWNGEKLGAPIDFYHDGIELRTLDLGTVRADFTNVLEAEIIGSNKNAVERHMFAIDYLKLVPEPQAMKTPHSRL